MWWSVPEGGSGNSMPDWDQRRSPALTSRRAEALERFSETPVEYRSAPPVLGQHTEEVLRSMGKTDAEIAGLRADGVI